MNKQTFINSLRAKLSGLPKRDVEERLAFYNEIIDDKIEEGLTEEEAVENIGTVEEIATQIMEEIPLATLVKEKIKPVKRLSAWEIVLVALGFPIWFPLLIAAFVVMVSLIATAFALYVSVWAVFVSLVAAAGGGIVMGIVYAFCGNALTGFALIGLGAIVAGLSIILFFGCLRLTKWIIKLGKTTIFNIKNALRKKEEI